MTRHGLRGASVLIGGKLQTGKALLLENQRITAVIDETELPRGIPVRTLEGGLLAPGYIDTQVNGGGGVLFNDDPSVETIRTIAAAHRRFGTTGILPTLISDDAEVIERGVRAVDQAIAEGIPGVLGIHLEGPLLSPRKSGIHDPGKFVAADADLLAIMASLRRGVTVVTLAPERVGVETIAKLTAAGVIVSAGHTDATYEETREAIAAGLRGFTHLFNAMSAMASRAPGAVGAALEDRDTWCGLIVDGVHVHPAVLRVALRSRPLDRFMLVTDAMPLVGTAATSFELQGRTIRVDSDRCVDEHGTLAGSALDMAMAVRNCVDLLQLEVAEAIGLAATAPAAFLRLDGERGQIAAGLTADLVWLDDRLQVRETWIAGQASSPAVPAENEV